VPTYEYQCDKCLQNFEVFQRFSDKPLRKHPECGGKVAKVFHPRGVTFKGSGFYVNDSRAKNGKSSDESSSSESSKEKRAKEKSPSSSESGSSPAADKAAVTSSGSKGD
jgi:putative FmdB family regulatory protein